MLDQLLKALGGGMQQQGMPPTGETPPIMPPMGAIPEMGKPATLSPMAQPVVNAHLSLPTPEIGRPQSAPVEGIPPSGREQMAGALQGLAQASPQEAPSFIPPPAPMQSNLLPRRTLKG